MMYRCFSEVMWFYGKTWARSFPLVHISSNAKRNVLQLNKLSGKENMVTTRHLKVASTCQTLPPRIPGINVEKHRRSYLPRRALM